MLQMKVSRKSVAGIAAGAAFVGWFVVSQVPRSWIVTTMIRFDTPKPEQSLTNVGSYDPYMASRILESARVVAHDPGYLAELATESRVDLKCIRRTQAEQYRCTSLLDVTVVFSEGQAAGDAITNISPLLIRRLADKFPNAIFSEVESRSFEPKTHWHKLLVKLGAEK